MLWSRFDQRLDAEHARKRVGVGMNVRDDDHPLEPIELRQQAI
jgi:hypothetical protein